MLPKSTKEWSVLHDLRRWRRRLDVGRCDLGALYSARDHHSFVRLLMDSFGKRHDETPGHRVRAFVVSGIALTGELHTYNPIMYGITMREAAAADGSPTFSSPFAPPSLPAYSSHTSTMMSPPFIGWYADPPTAWSNVRSNAS